MLHELCKKKESLFLPLLSLHTTPTQFWFILPVSGHGIIQGELSWTSNASYGDSLFIIYPKAGATADAVNVT